MNVATITIIVIIALGCLTLAYLLGRIHQQTHDEKVGLIAQTAVDEFPEVPIDMPDEREVELQDIAIEMVGYLDVATGPIRIVTPVLADASQVTRIDLGDVPLLAARAERDRWRERFEHAERLRARYLRLLRVERARLHYMLGDVMDAPRRPRKLSLVGVQVEVGKRHLQLVPPIKAREWREAAA